MINEQSIYKLIESLKKYGITFSEKDGDFENVVFEKGDFEVKIAHEMFYRKSGLAVCYDNGRKENEIQIKPMTDDMFYNRIKSIVLYLLKVETE